MSFPASKSPIQWDDFEKIDIRVGTIREVKDFPKAKKPAYQLVIDFGALGIKNASAQITHLYGQEELIGRQIVAIVNFPPKQIANFFSECLVLGVYTDKNEVVLLAPGREVENGWKVG
jgi:tRNA-binding protein